MPKSYIECDYSAFISYSHDDDTEHFKWCSHFYDELARSLRSSSDLREALNNWSDKPKPEIYFDKRSTPLSGILSDNLKQAIADSFMMIIIVGGHYAQSDWCLKELRYFKEIFGNNGYLERLNIIALSNQAYSRIKRSASDLLPFDDQILVTFYKDDEPNASIPVYESKEILNEDFKKRFKNFRNHLIKKIKDDIEKTERDLPITPGIKNAEVIDRSPSLLPNPPTQFNNPSFERVIIFIESNIRPKEKELWKILGDEIRKKWDEIVRNMQVAPPLYISSRGLPIDEIAKHPHLKEADGVVLFWGEKDPPALVEQIHAVESKLPGRDLAPSIVAYLMPPQPNPNHPIPAWSWKVLRFNNQSEKSTINVVQEEEKELENFLCDILKRKRKNQLPPEVLLAQTPTQ